MARHYKLPRRRLPLGAPELREAANIGMVSETSIRAYLNGRHVRESTAALVSVALEQIGRPELVRKAG
jgi:hypothetical protein